MRLGSNAAPDAIDRCGYWLESSIISKKAALALGDAAKPKLSHENY